MRIATASLLALVLGLPVAAQAPMTPPKAQAGPFDAPRDAAKDLQAAKEEAHKTGRRILLDVGGNWCSWCRLMDRWFTENKDLHDLRDKDFVVVLVNYSPDNKNEALLSQYPAIEGYPHFFVLDADGKLLRSQDTGELEEGKGYSRAKMTAFLQAWSGK
jgi:thioredoxin-related protein